MSKKATHLEVVPDDATAPAQVTDRIAENLDSDSRSLLASMRLALAQKLDKGEVSSNSIASAYKELRELDRLIREIDDAKKREASAGDAGSTRPRRSFNASAL